MTDEEIRNLWRSHDDVIEFARAIEQKVREEIENERKQEHEDTN